jgi:hypothetical protein
MPRDQGKVVTWADLMEQIAMHREPRDILIVTTTAEKISAVLMDDMEQTAPVGTKFWRNQWQITLPNGTRIRFALLRNERDLANLRGTRWDAIVFDPQWRDPGGMEDQLVAFGLKRDPMPPLVVG